MSHKIQLTAEALFIFLSINWGQLSGLIMGIPAAVYYLSMLKINVIDKQHEGSWKKYIKSLFKF